MQNQKLVILSSSALGDSLYMSIIAHAYAAHDYDVVFYSDALFELRTLFPDINIKNYKDDVMADIGSADQLILSPESHLITSGAIDLSIMQKATLLMIKGMPSKKIPKSVYKYFKKHGVILRAHYKNRLIIDNMRAYLHELFPGYITSNPSGLSIPVSWQREKNARRIIMHPFSSLPKRSWPLSNFLELADRLQDQGYKVMITASPSERQSLDEYIKRKYDVPDLSLFELAERYYQSNFFIGNDSGPGHLASSLGIPVYTILFSGRKSFYWEPCFSLATIIQPPLYKRLQRKLVSREYYKRSLSVGRVMGHIADINYQAEE